jgi:Flp pilus assembly protein TadG
METQILKRISEIAHMSRTIEGARQRFAKDESGTMILFALILFVLMAMMGGIAVDLMRYEATRTTLQNTLDRSTLAASSLGQKLGAENVVRDYVAKAGMTPHLKSVTVTSGVNFRTVNAKGLADTQPLFLHMIGIDKLEAPGAATAEQRSNKIEIALVLDVSGSMLDNSKLTNMKTAAKEFVDTVLKSDTDNQISIALVPYNGQVNLGNTMASYYNVTLPNGRPDTKCVDLPPVVYTTRSMSDTLELPQTANADAYYGTNRSAAYSSATSTDYSNGGAALDAGRWCVPSTVNILRPPSNNATNLKSYISNLEGIGATSINAGLKWGLAMLDPASRPLFEDLADDDVIIDDFDDRPFDYVDTEATKIIVLMTDGSHFAETRINEAYKGGASTIYKGSDGYYSVKHETADLPSAAGSNRFFVPHLCTSSACTNGSNTAEAWKATAWKATDPQTWPQVWADLRVSWVAWQLYARALGTDSTTMDSKYSAWMANFRKVTAIGDMDNQLQAICTLAKSAGNVVIYGIAFSAPTAGQQQIKMCTSGYNPAYPNDANPYYYVSSSTTIQKAFRSIAINISQLRLIQ